ncbi:DMT family transporter [Verrucosispora sp. NA02020]|uniref:DMT family transporter n=2 Tax=unclassified Micromonospora TaxID=2617518 RepID=UPI0015919357|nr:DMT family transporter [Verrucosispora sp. NA02020]QKW13931.1 DMT family transporter [Verrucosispora sp. NA02020]
MRPLTSRATGDRTWLVAVAASLWGFSSLLREPLARELPALSVVLAEHVVLVLLVSPWVIPAVRALARSSARTKLAVLVIGAGSSALATTLFTAAFRLGDPITPQVLQKLQPVLALVLAALLLGERVGPRFPLFAVPALVGAWLLAFPDPLAAQPRGLAAAALALGAAALWAAGTVLGRMVSAELSFLHVTTLRFSVGLVTLTTFAAATGTPVGVPIDLVPRLVLLAAIPGLLALTLYYHALRRTPASNATLAELAFPLTAALVGLTLLDGRLGTSQWVGLALVLASVVLLALHENRSSRPAVRQPEQRVPQVVGTSGNAAGRSDSTR